MSNKKSCYGPAPDVRGTVNAYWIERRERRLAARKPTRKRTSKKEFDKPIDLWEKVI
jgi:hypothetical protein